MFLRCVVAMLCLVVLRWVHSMSVSPLFEWVLVDVLSFWFSGGCVRISYLVVVWQVAAHSFLVCGHLRRNSVLYRCFLSVACWMERDRARERERARQTDIQTVAIVVEVRRRCVVLVCHCIGVRAGGGGVPTMEHE